MRLSIETTGTKDWKRGVSGNTGANAKPLGLSNTLANNHQRRARFQFSNNPPGKSSAIRRILRVSFDRGSLTRAGRDLNQIMIATPMNCHSLIHLCGAEFRIRQSDHHQRTYLKTAVYISLAVQGTHFALSFRESSGSIGYRRRKEQCCGQFS